MNSFLAIDEMKNMINYGRRNVYGFMRRLEELQFKNFNGRPEWITIKMKNLNLFMAYTYFGYPNITDDTNGDSDILNLYKDEEKECINNMIEVIKTKITLKDINTIRVGITMVHSTCKNPCAFCTSRAKQYTHVWYLLRLQKRISVLYVDLAHKTTYYSFDDYIKNNLLSPGLMFFPESGMYEENKYLVPTLTPSSRKAKSVTNIIEYYENLSKPLGHHRTHTLTCLTHRSQTVLNKEFLDHLLNLAISVLGPTIGNKLFNTEHLIRLRTTEFDRSSLSSLQEGSYIAQLSLEAMYDTLHVFNDIKEITLKNLISLHLDLFAVGVELPINNVQKVLEAMWTATNGPRCYRNLLSQKYCLSQYTMRATCFVVQHMEEFLDKLANFSPKRITLDKLVFAWETYRRCIAEYRRQLATIHGRNLVYHVVQNVMKVSIERDAQLELSGYQMIKLLNKLGVANDLWAIEFCVLRVLRSAYRLRADHRSAVASGGPAAANQVDEEFCRRYRLTQCTFVQFVLHSIRQAAAEQPSVFWNAYGKFPKQSKRNRCLVASHKKSSRLLTTFAEPTPADCFPLSSDYCCQYAKIIDPENKSDYHKVQHLSLSHDTAIVFTYQRTYLLNVVLFSVDSFGDDGATLQTSIYRDWNPSEATDVSD